MRKIHLVCFSLLSAVAVWACSSGDDGSSAQGGSAISAPEGGKSPASAASSSSSAGAPTAPPPAGSAASTGSSAAADACTAACDQQHPAGIKAEKADDDAFQKCLCGASTCGSACGSTKVCTESGAEPVDGDACFTCLASPAASVCEQQGDAACQAEPDCAALQACYDACFPKSYDGAGSPSK